MDSSSTRLPPLPSFSTLLWILVGFFLLSFAVYGASIAHNSLVMWDDNHLIFSNPHIRSLGWSNIVYNFTHFDPELYVPLTFLSYQLDYLIGGAGGAIYHFSNLVLHMLNALLVSGLLYALMRKGWIAVLCGALFLVHPLHTEAVAWASARKDLLSTFFFLLSSLLYLRATADGHRKSYFYSIAAFALGLLSKVSIVTLPVVLLLVDLLRGRPITRRTLLEKIPYLLLSVVFGAVAVFGKQEVITKVSPWEMILIAFKSTAFYMQKLLLPIDLSVMYPFTEAITLSSQAFFVPATVILVIAALAALSLRHTRVIALTFAFYLLTLVPTFFNVVKTGDINFASDRYAYIPSIGVLLLIAWVVGRIVPDTSFRRRKPWVIGFAALTVVLALMANRQAKVWRDSESLFEHVIALYPESVPARLNLAMVYRQTNRDAEALEQLNDVLALREHPRAYTTMATIKESQGKRSEAYALYNKAAALEPKDPEPHFGLGLLAMRDKKKELALREYQTALELDPAYAAVHLNIATLHLQYEELDAAAQHYHKALDIDPFLADAHFNLGVIQEEQGDLEDAARSFEAVHSLDPLSIDAYVHLATLYLKLQRTKDAVHAVHELNRLAPRDEDAQFLLQTFRKHGLIKK